MSNIGFKVGDIVRATEDLRFDSTVPATMWCISKGKFLRVVSIICYRDERDEIHCVKLFLELLAPGRKIEIDVPVESRFVENISTLVGDFDEVCTI